MAIKFSTKLRNDRLDSIETSFSTAPTIVIYGGTVPTDANTAISGQSVLASFALPSDWLAAASGGAKALSGSWSGTGGAGAGTGTTATFFRIYNAAALSATAGSAANPCLQGTASGSGGGGDLILDNASIANGQTVTVTAFTITDGNA